MRPAWPALLVVPLLVLALAGCVSEPEVAETPLTPGEACAALGEAVADYYDNVSPGSTTEALDTWTLPVIAGFTIPKPTCAFQVRPDPKVIPGDVFTIENFYLDYDETMTVSLPARLEAAGFTRKNPNFATWALSKLNRSYSAALQVFRPDDGQSYSTAAEHFRLIDLTIGQN
jgi:hypothetical protein